MYYRPPAVAGIPAGLRGPAGPGFRAYRGGADGMIGMCQLRGLPLWRARAGLAGRGPGGWHGIRAGPAGPGAGCSLWWRICSAGGAGPEGTEIGDGGADSAEGPEAPATCQFRPPYAARITRKGGAGPNEQCIRLLK